MSSQVHYIITGFDAEVCRDVLHSLYKALEETLGSSDRFDFIIDPDEYAAVEETMNTEFDLTIYHRFSLQKQRLTVEFLPVAELLALANAWPYHRSIAVFYCFPDTILQEGYMPFESISQEYPELLKVQLSDFMEGLTVDKQFNLIWRTLGSMEERWNYLEQLNLHPEMFLDGQNLSAYLHQPSRDLKMYESFLKLPTAIVNQNYFPLKIISCGNS